MTAFTKTFVDGINPFDGSKYRLQFDGSHNYVDVGAMGSLGGDLGNGFYCKFDIITSTTSTSSIMGQLTTGNSSFEIEINTNGSGTIRFFFRDGGGVVLDGHTGNISLNDGSLHTIEMTVTFSTNTIVVKIDGVSKTISYTTQNTPATFSNFGHTMVFGAKRDTNTLVFEFLNGTLGNVLIGTSSTNIYGFWPMNEGSGTTLRDASGNGNTGTLSGTPKPSFNSVSGTNLLSLATAKAYAESISPSEVFVKAYATAISLSISLIETIQLFTSQIKSESISLVEMMGNFVTGKTLTETITPVETFSHLATLFRTFSDQIIPTEIFIKAYSTVYADAVSLIETMGNFFTTKTLSEAIALTENFSWHAVFARLLTDSISPSETLQKLTSKVLSDIDSIIEAVTHFVAYITSDSISPSEVFQKAYSTLFSDSISPHEILNILHNNTMIFLNSISLIETFQELSSKATFSESISLVEQFIKTTGKPLSGAISLTESFLKAIGRAFNDYTIQYSLLLENGFHLLQENGYRLLLDTPSINVPETIQKLTVKNISDSISLGEIIGKITNYIMKFVDAISLHETVSRLLNRPLSDSISLVESLVQRIGHQARRNKLFKRLGQLFVAGE